MYSAALARSRSASRARTARTRVSLNTHRYSRWTEPFTKSYDSQGINNDFEFRFNDIISYSEFTNLYDQFKIDYVVVHLSLITNPDASFATNNVPTAATNSSNWFPKLWYIRDYDSGSAETLTSIKERQGVKYFVMRPNRSYTIKIRPTVLVQTYRTSTTTGYGPKRMALDFANGVDVPHYGLRTVFDTLGLNPVDNQAFQVRCEVKYYFTCKNVR